MFEINTDECLEKVVTGMDVIKDFYTAMDSIDEYEKPPYSEEDLTIIRMNHDGVNDLIIKYLKENGKDYKEEVSDFCAYKDSMLKKESKEISKLRKEVNETTKNYCTVFHSIYNKFGAKGLKDILEYMKENDPESYESFIEHQKLDKEMGRPYFKVKEITDDFVHDLTYIDVKYCSEDFDFKKYVKQAVRTDSTLNEPFTYRILHSMIGVAGELSEAIEHGERDYEAMVSEIGDVVWYIALYYDAIRKTDKEISSQSLIIEHAETNFDPKRYLTKKGELKSGYEYIEYACFADDGSESDKYEYFSGILDKFLLRSAKALDAYKKHYFYKQPLEYKHLKQFDELCFDIIVWLQYLDANREETDNRIYSLGEITNANIEKLKARYPDRFTVEDSLNRDYEKESKQSGLTVK